MPTIVLTLPDLPRHRRSAKPDPLAALADLAARAAQIGQMPIATKENMQQTILARGLSDTRARQLIGRTDDSDGRTRLLFHSDRTSERVEITSRNADVL